MVRNPLPGWLQPPAKRFSLPFYTLPRLSLHLLNNVKIRAYFPAIPDTFSTALSGGNEVAMTL